MNLESILTIIILAAFLIFFLLLVRWYGEIKRGMFDVRKNMENLVLVLQEISKNKKLN